MARKYVKLSQTLKRLLFEKDMRPIDLARELNMQPPTLHRMVTGKCTRPAKESLNSIAEFFNVSFDQLVGDKPLSTIISGEVTPAGSTSNAQAIPVIPWDKLPNDFQSEQKIFVLSVSGDAFAVDTPDHSMEPIFPKGATLIFDPQVTPSDRDYVLVRLDKPSVYTFRQLLIDATKRFIKALNPDFGNQGIQALDDSDKIIARLVEVRNVL